MKTEVTDSADALAVAVADHVTAAIRDAVATRGAAVIAFSGGTTPEPMLRRLATRDIPWTKVTVFQVDERVAPDGHGDRNAAMLQRALLDHVDAAAHLMPVTDDDLESAAQRYAQLLGDAVLDMVHLGLGADGHTASLVPGDPVLEVEDRWVALTDEYQGRRRMTLTYPAINQAGTIIWEVAGDDKAEAVIAMLTGGEVPASRVSKRQATLITDARAGRLLQS